MTNAVEDGDDVVGKHIDVDGRGGVFGEHVTAASVVTENAIFAVCEFEEGSDEVVPYAIVDEDTVYEHQKRCVGISGTV
jgi:hypothetical protein